MILRTFRSCPTRLRAYKAYVLPRLDYCSYIFSPYLITDIENLESIQHHFTKSILYRSQFAPASYEERLSKLKLQTIESRRYERDLIFCHKIYRESVDLNFSDFFTISKNRRLPHHAITVTAVKSSDAYRFCFARRVRPAWNSIPFDIICGSNNEVRTFLKQNTKTFIAHTTSVVRRLGTIAT